MVLRLIGKEVWGYGKESARPAIEKLHVGVRGRQPCALTSLQPLLNLSKLDLKE